MKKNVIIILLAFVSFSCQKKDNSGSKPINNNNVITTTLDSSNIIENQNDCLKDKGEEWLKSIFKSNNSDKYFPDYDVEDKLCTKRYKDFIYEIEEIYGASNYTDEERDSAEIKYKEKWSNIYPIEKEEMWLFGRGNGDTGELIKLEISKISDLKYNVNMVYRDNTKTKNIVTLVIENESYKIDYCKTEFIK